MYHHIFIHSSVDGHLSYFHVLAIINSTAMNIGMHVSLSILVSSGYTPRSGIAGTYGGFIPSFLRNLHTIFHSGCINLSCHQQFKNVPFPPTPSPAFIVCSVFYDGHSDWCEVVSHCGWAVKICLQWETWISSLSRDGGHDNPLQYSCLEDPMDKGAWKASVLRWHRVRHDWSD